MRQRGFVALLISLALVGSACTGERYVKFDHDEHAEAVKDVEALADCSGCHKLVEGAYLMPTHATCGPGCHPAAIVDIAEAKAKASKACLECHQLPNLPNTLLVKASLGLVKQPAPTSEFFDRFQTLQRPIESSYEDVMFSHTEHEDSKCQTCHAEIFKKVEATKTFTRTMEGCIGCHTAEGIGTSCDTCHRTTRQDIAPPSHTALWRETHGAEARRDGQPCTYCHGASTGVQQVGVETGTRQVAAGADCESCHKLERPRSHTLRWDQELHGRAAIANRERCEVCHEQDSCTSCHNQKPFSHFAIANFERGGHITMARRDQRACFVCHQFGDFCADCHFRFGSERGPGLPRR